MRYHVVNRLSVFLDEKRKFNLGWSFNPGYPRNERLQPRSVMPL